MRDKPSPAAGRRGGLDEDEHPQPRELYDKLRSGKTLIRFTEEEGADSHCEPAANGIRGERT